MILSREGARENSTPSGVHSVHNLLKTQSFYEVGKEAQSAEKETDPLFPWFFGLVRPSALRLGRTELFS